MNDEILSIFETEKNTQNIQQEEKFSTNRSWVLAAIVLNVFIYSITYFEWSLVVYSNGEEKEYIFYVLMAVGYYIGYDTIEFYKQSRGESIEEDRAQIDADFMKTYRRDSFLEEKKFIHSFSIAAGAFNGFVYLVLFSFFVE
jgi:hypothetical protein